MSNKIVIIGIDGLDSALLSDFMDDLPNLRKLKEGCQDIEMMSVFPPDSPTAWMSIYTGLNPARHGGIFFKDPLNPKKAGSYMSLNIAHKTFWDILSKNGKKVCVLFPFLGYPPWDVNGVIVSRTTETDLKRFDVRTMPEGLSKKYNLSELKPLSSHPLDRARFIEETKKLIVKEVKSGIEIFNDFDWDMFFIYFSELDNIEHNFWMYCDKNDPAYHPDNPYRNIIRDFYKFFDKEVIGRFKHEIEKSKTSASIYTAVISDHGHAMRPVNIININGILKREGFLYPRFSGKDRVRRSVVLEKMKNIMVRAISESRLLRKMAYMFLEVFPKSLKTFTALSPIDFNRTIAFVSDPSGGLKAYCYAGLRIIKKNIPNDKSYEEIRESLIKIIMQIKEIDWCRKREEVYSGNHLNKYPDILFKLKDNFGVGWNINEEIYNKSYSHKLHSGNHKRESAVFILSPTNNFNMRTKETGLMDIAPTVLDILGIRGDFDFDGKSIIEKQI